MDRVTRNELALILKSSISNLYAVTGKMGLSLNEEKKFFQGAKEAARLKKSVKTGKILWVPILEKKDVLLVCGIITKKSPTTEIKLINGLYQEFKYRIFLKSQLEAFRDPKSSFIKKLLLTDEIKTMDQAMSNGDIVDANLRSPQAVILIRIPGFLEKAQKKDALVSGDDFAENIRQAHNEVIKTITQAFNNFDQNVVTCLESDTFIVLKWVEGEINTLNTINFFKDKARYIESIIKKKTGLSPQIGVGQYYPGLNGLKKSFSDAKIALELGEKLLNKGNVHHITDVGLFISLLKDIQYEQECELAHQILGKIISDKDIYKTIKVFLECNMSLTDSAKKLHVHRNTLIYRLDRVKNEVGLDPRKFNDAVQIKLGMILYSPLTSNCQEK